MNKEEYADKFISRAKQDIKICENEHELQVYIAGLLENIDYWQNEYDYMKKYRDTLQQENKQLKKQIKEALIDLDFFIEKYGLWQHKELIEIEETLRGNKNDKKKKNKTN